MEEIANGVAALPLEDVSSMIDADQAMSHAARSTEIKLRVDTMVHAYRCENADCGVEKCSKMKKFRMHMESHVERSTQAICMSCRICRYVIFMASLHARACNEADECPVPFCTDTKLKLTDPDASRMADAARELKRLMNEFNPNIPSIAGL